MVIFSAFADRITKINWFLPKIQVFIVFSSWNQILPDYCLCIRYFNSLLCCFVCFTCEMCVRLLWRLVMTFSYFSELKGIWVMLILSACLLTLEDDLIRNLIKCRIYWTIYFKWMEMWWKNTYKHPINGKQHASFKFKSFMLSNGIKVSRLIALFLWRIQKSLEPLAQQMNKCSFIY